MKPCFIVIFQQIVGCPKDGYGTSYSWDLERFSTPNKAIRHGLKTRGSDDFNIARVKGETLLDFRWMDKIFSPEDYPLCEIADQLGLGAK